MEIQSEYVIQPLAYLTVAGQILSVLLAGILIYLRIYPKNLHSKKITKFVNDYYISLILLISAIATLGSLTFSEILKFVPCKLCWYQRIFMYPLFLISGIALLTNENIRKYILTLSSIGFLIAIYHILVQFFPQALECSDEVAKCSTREFATFGYITIPVMSATAFLLIILFSLFPSKTSRK